LSRIPIAVAIGLVLALKPLELSFGIGGSVQVTTMQAVSGAGYPGVASLDILGQRGCRTFTAKKRKLEAENG